MCKGYTSVLQFADIIIDTFGSSACDEAFQMESSPFPPNSIMASCSPDVESSLNLDPIPMDADRHHEELMTPTSSLFELLGNAIKQNHQHGNGFTGIKISRTIPKPTSRTSRKRKPTSKRYCKIKDPNGVTLQCRDMDILLGRGGHACNHPGNVKLLHVIKMKRSAYKCVGRTEIGIARKRAIVHQIVSDVHSTGSRFLYREKKGGEWREASNRAVYEKICHMLRD